MGKEPQLHEKNRYQDSNFPFEIYTVNRYNMFPMGRGFNNLHWHEEIQYTIAAKGDLTIQVNGKAYQLREGDGIFINSGYLHVTKKMQDQGEYFSINFNPRLLSFSLGSLLEQNYVLPYVGEYLLPITIFRPEVPWEKEVLDKFFAIHQLYQEKQTFAWEYKLVILLSSIWDAILSNTKMEITNQGQLKLKQNRMQELLDFVHQHFGEAITIKEMAEAAHISPTECTRCFKEFTDYSPYEYLIQYRISEAKQQLMQTDDSIQQIAIQTGFHESSSFIQAFKKRVGITPLKYRIHQGRI
ncbi:AraC family transcriptional regulator [Candidatus Enterococcus ferrettii]|uniref:HTH araC/xylS-type domain-containing protein n=1 Tax=Candidatus Enterococcus ferrettii TaxID=2815324 RepID=A0ABV0ETB4_9ENTE|nr:AraC family transcriptional regulator [Enterococcus sp. 665A]MBO1340248.1 helix-turn-helix transcriptional regulator [Enterococcus sp. 665A]